MMNRFRFGQGVFLLGNNRIPAQLVEGREGSGTRKRLLTRVAIRSARWERREMAARLLTARHAVIIGRKANLASKQGAKMFCVRISDTDPDFKDAHLRMAQHPFGPVDPALNHILVRADPSRILEKTREVVRAHCCGRRSGAFDGEDNACGPNTARSSQAVDALAAV